MRVLVGRDDIMWLTMEKNRVLWRLRTSKFRKAMQKIEAKFNAHLSACVVRIYLDMYLHTYMYFWLHIIAELQIKVRTLMNDKYK